MDKSPDAFRTISEVAEWLDVPTHVLRFWESRFSQVKPVKRAGGRRYYRPADMRLIGGIKKLLHEDGMTIRGVQKLLREEGVKHVAGFSQPLEHEHPAAIEMPSARARSPEAMPEDAPELSFLPPGPSAGSEPEPEPEPVQVLRAAEPEIPAEAEPEAGAAADRSEPAATDAAGSAPEPLDAAEDAPPESLAASAADQPAPAASAPPPADERAAVEDAATAPAPADQAGAAVPPAPSEAQVVAFGSVRGARAREDELPLGTPDETAAASPETDGADLIDEATLDPAVSETGEPPIAPDGAGPVPLVADAPDTDPADDAPTHARAPGAAARLLMLDRSVLKEDGIRIEQVVAALRAVRDRSAS